MEKIMLKITRYGITIPVTFRKSHYVENDNLYVGIVCWGEGYPEPWSDLTVNLSVKCEDDCAFIDINNNGEVIDWLIENNIAVPTGRVEASGFCLYPEVRFNKDFLAQLDEN